MTTFFEHGFLGTRGSFMLDFVCLAMAVIVPLLGISVYLVKVRRQYAIHKWVQLTLGFVLAVAVVAFEVDLRLVTDWQKLAGPSPFFRAGHLESGHPESGGASLLCGSDPPALGLRSRAGGAPIFQSTSPRHTQSAACPMGVAGHDGNRHDRTHRLAVLRARLRGHVRG